MFAFPPQNTVVVERWWQVPLSKRGSPPRLYPRRHGVYRLVEDTKQSPTAKMELILTQTVPSKWLQNHFEKHEVLHRHHGTYSCLMSDFFCAQSWEDVATLCSWKSPSAETSFCLKALQCIHRQTTNRCLQKSWECVANWYTHICPPQKNATTGHWRVSLFINSFCEKGSQKTESKPELDYWWVLHLLES